MTDPVSQEVRQRAAAIRLAVFDVDGVLTDGRLYLGEDNSEARAFHTRDGLGLIMLLAAGLRVAVISGKKSNALEQRMGSMGIQDVLHGRNDKLRALEELLERTGLRSQQACFTGDDILDLPPMAAVGLAVAVADAHPSVRRAAHWITGECGGRGAAREVCDLLLESQERMVSTLRALEQRIESAANAAPTATSTATSTE